MGYSFIPQVLFYFLLTKRRQHRERRIQDADTLPFLCATLLLAAARAWEKES